MARTIRISVEIAREQAVRRGITINGLPLLLKPGSFDGYFEMVNLDDYYEDCVIGGTGAFIVPMRALSEFVPAIRRKLVMEIAGRQPTAISAAFTRVSERRLPDRRENVEPVDGAVLSRVNRLGRRL